MAANDYDFRVSYLGGAAIGPIVLCEFLALLG